MTMRSVIDVRRPLRPRLVLTWGIALILGGVALEVLLPAIGAAIATARPSSAMDQDLLLALDLAARLVRLLVAPVGAALIGASLVMFFLAPLVERADLPIGSRD